MNTFWKGNYTLVKAAVILMPLALLGLVATVLNFAGWWSMAFVCACEVGAMLLLYLFACNNNCQPD